MEFFIILTLGLPARGGMQQITVTRTVTANGSTTRSALYLAVRSELPPEFAEHGNVLFFSAEPNQLGS